MNDLDAARHLLSGAAHPASFSGAGLSAESGIPTFRDPVEGLWARYDPMTLASREGFLADPDLVIAWYGERRRAAARARPNPAHEALARWRTAVHITQNVDDLLERAGAVDVIHLHGRLAFDRCDRRCGYRATIAPASPSRLRSCPGCGALLRPDVVWFGEILDEAEWERAHTVCERADVLVVVGTSGAVQPAASLVAVARAGGARIVLVNPGESEFTGSGDIELTGKAGEILPSLVPGRA